MGFLWRPIQSRSSSSTEVAAAASRPGNGDRSENADYQYGKRRLRQIDGRIRFLTKRIEAAEVVDPEAPRTGQAVIFPYEVLQYLQQLHSRRVDEAIAYHGA